MANVNIGTITEILKTTYGPALANQLNDKASPLLANIKKKAVAGKEFKVAAPYGINGGVGFSTDNGDLPAAGGQNYKSFVGTLKSVYAPIEFSDMAWKMSMSDAGAFLDVAKNEFSSAETALKFNLGRSVFGDGTGKIASTAALSTAGNTVTVTAGMENLIEGLIVDFYATGGSTPSVAGRRITSVNRTSKAFTFDGVATTLSAGFITVQKSYNNEITGLGAVFGAPTSIYGVDKASNAWIVPYDKAAESNAVDDDQIFDVLATLQNYKGSDVNMIICGQAAYKYYSAYLREQRKSTTPTIELNGGFKAISFVFNNREIPVVMDRFAENGSMYFIDTDKLALYGVGDWEWIQYGDGSIIQRMTTRPVYQAVMARYCELLCEHPGGIGRLTGIQG